METVVRAAIVYAALFLLMRIAGKKELSGMSSFELVLLVIMGDLVQQGVTQQDTSMTTALLAVSTIVIIMVTVSYVSFRFQKVNPVTEGLPVVIMRNGRIMRQALAVERLTEDEVQEAAREQGIGDLKAVLVGILETDGTFSFVTTSGEPQQQHGQEPPAS
jgi:uncharacterized membrane protein YcaP (DUF421 family)